MNQYGYFLNRVMQPVAPAEGASGYFAAPKDELDPELFVPGERLKPNVREWILSTLYTYWETKYNRPRDWSTVWIAGSAISYQWAADRGGVGDLDILIGVDYPMFFMYNPELRGTSPKDLSAVFNREFYEELWPSTAEISLDGGRPFEVTFYVNPNSTDIRDIRPYAAYDVTHDEWTVRPPEGEDFNHPKAFYDSAAKEVENAWGLVEKYNQAADQAAAMQPGTPGWHNAMRQAELIVSQAASTYDQIHSGRRVAFSQSGSGYGDYYNFRWQYHKQHGTANALNAVAKKHKEAQAEFASNTYGLNIDAADVALRRAALWNRGRR